MPLRKDLHEANRASWNAATPAHNSHKGDQAAFLRGGGSTLFPEELRLLGDVRGKSLVHLQCNAGQDTLSLAALGAQVTGVDISDEAICFANGLSRDSGLPGSFVRQDVYDWFAATAQGSERFDLAFSSYGALYWLSDIAEWGRGVASVLKPGGRFVGVEFHPVWMVFDEEWRLHYPYGEGEVVTTSGVSDYVGKAGDGLWPWGFQPGEREFKNPHPDHGFQWGLGEIIGALLGAGLRLEALEEYPYSNGCKLLNRMRELPGRRMIPPEDVPRLPLMFGLSARKPD